MRDWCAIVREKLMALDLPPSQQEETVRELAAHLEDDYESGISSGLNDSEAFERTLGKCADWRALARMIHRARRQEEIMNYRTRSLWVPGMVCTLGAMGSRMILVLSGIEPKILYPGSKVGSSGLEIYLPWLILLPAIGAVAAFLSRRADGKRPRQIVAALFPCLIFVGLFLFGLAVTIFSRHPTPPRELLYAFGLAELNWIVIPGAALFLGALPFLRPVRLSGAPLAVK